MIHPSDALLESQDDLLAEVNPDATPDVTLGTILIVDDSPRIQKVLRRIFTDERYTVVIAEDGPTALDLFRSLRPLAVVLDLILPNASGCELCRSFKSLSSDTPVVVLSAVTDVADKVQLLELGADDYVTKPFSPRELTARVQAAIRRQQKPVDDAVYRFGSCEVDFRKMTVWREGVSVVLTAHEFKLLKFFTDNAEQVLARDQLLNEVWGYNLYPATRTVDNQILKLRQKLEPDPASPRHLLTIYGAGYKFVP